jgi:hypothetical protein
MYVANYITHWRIPAYAKGKPDSKVVKWEGASIAMLYEYLLTLPFCWSSKNYSQSAKILKILKRIEE